MFWFLVFFFKQKTAYEMRISDWSSDVCSSDLAFFDPQHFVDLPPHRIPILKMDADMRPYGQAAEPLAEKVFLPLFRANSLKCAKIHDIIGGDDALIARHVPTPFHRSEEHTSELQSLMRISYAVFCLQKKTTKSFHK